MRTEIENARLIIIIILIYVLDRYRKLLFGDDIMCC